MKIKLKLLLSFLVLIVVLLAEIVAVWAVNFELMNEYRKLTNNLILENTFTESVQNMIETYYLVVLAPTSNDRLDEYMAQRKSIMDALSTLDTEIVKAESKTSYKGLKNIIMNIVENCDKGVDAISKGDIKTASGYYNDGLNKKFFVSENTATLMMNELKYAKTLQENIDGTRNLTTTLSTILTSIVVLACISFSFILSRKITQPIIKLSKTADRIANEKITEIVDKGLLKMPDEIGSLSRSFDTMTKKMRAKIEELESAKNIAEKAKNEAEVSKNKLEQTNADLERFNKLSVGRELKMVELKKKIADLEENLKKSN